MSVFLTCRLKNSIGRKKFFNFSSDIVRQLSQQVKQNESFVPFMDVIKFRREEARRSILVQVQSAQSFKELHSYCNSVGNVRQMLHYTVGVEPLNFIVVEFASEKDVTNVLERSSYLEDSQVVPVQSQFLWFRASNRKLPKLKQSKSAILSIENGNQCVTPSEIVNLLSKCDSVSEQMNVLYNSTKLNDLGTRLRFLTARQVENAVRGMFPKAKAYPFGSSVNGYGKMGCDLDLVLRLCDDKVKNDARLMFHCKGLVGSERTASQRNMEAIGDLLQLFLPGCSQVRRILQARVPIIKYYQQLTDVECDLSMANMSGVHMSDFLYIMGSLDARIRPLVFTIRKWASEIGLTNSSPGRWITNFSLTLLVLAFLQKPINSKPILPSLNTLVKLAEPKDSYMTEDGINCTFLRDITKLKTPTENKESLETLLVEFFEFYSQFDFASKALCLNESVAITKPEHCALYIVNPLERGLNVSKNVSMEELDRFRVEARNAAWILESQENKNENWGILSIFENKRKASSVVNFAFANKHGRLVEVSTLFEENTDKPVEYKNASVKKQVENIKNDTKNKLKELQKTNR
ncbi:poly(A) RNA polymerase, mitochondrial [Tribolium castaneum]|uniref:Poly(A) RNA polymerase, mitochondrial-like Protein n=1 Tax=Tribolium castaneum TaxID=7070 RepID=D6WRJ4_TRICA|nr:PREDICTED: poly(A) RNA polymerase, mitochondrial [Tribolium castaneum]EFA06440.1 Poly(A) RNA polymerase, mitochondrial-like Protein [Tribolium castaneum]|eukprot:XP_008195200.1 PREDICTED: poly(A) RNA polymerase, mitochondrial [Tribolium castaneum]